MRAKEDDKTRETIHELNKQKIHYQKLEKKRSQSFTRSFFDFIYKILSGIRGFILLQTNTFQKIDTLLDNCQKFSVYKIGKIVYLSFD